MRGPTCEVSESAKHGVLAVVPTKSFSRAKSRLSEVLTVGERQRLARQLFEHVIDVVQSSSAIEAILVPTDCAEVARCAEALGAEALRDPHGATLGAVVDAALELAWSRGARRALVLMSDLPWLTPDDVNRLLASPGDVVLAPDRRDEGTNALRLSRRSLPHTCFGHEDSLRRHWELAAEYGVEASVVRRAGLAFDVDSISDYHDLQSQG